MDTETTSAPLEISLPYPPTFWWRVLYGLFVIIMPIFSFSMVNVMKPEWQSGKLSDYAILFLFPQASLFILPLLVYSIVCYILLLIDIIRFASKFSVRFGIYSGVFLALHFSIAMLLSLQPSPWLFALLIAWIAPLVVSRVYPWAVKNWNMRLLGILFAGLVAVLALASMITSRNFFSPFFTVLVLITIVAPFWSFLLSAQAANWLIKNHESKLTLLRGLSIVAWLTAYITALRFDILKMYELYAALPPQPPDCYIATAAAKGHPRFVGSQPARLTNGNLIQVNRQLQRLKSVELAIMAVSPMLHKSIRRIYDVIGKRLAIYIQNPYLADIAFLILLPAEWSSFFILELFIPESQAVSKKIYNL